MGSRLGPVWALHEHGRLRIDTGQVLLRPDCVAPPANPARIISTQPNAPMPAKSTLTEQLANLGMHLPAWPEEAESGGATVDWIKRGQTYAEGVQLWRAQLRNIDGIDEPKAKNLIHDLREASEISDWDLRVFQYILSNMREPGQDEGVISATKLVEPEGLTDSQLLGASLELLNSSFIATGIIGIKQVLLKMQPDAEEQVRIFALLINAIPAISDDAAADYGYWKRKITFHLEVAKLLCEACNFDQGDNHSSLIAQLGILSDAGWDQSIEIISSRKQWITSLREQEPMIAGMASIPSRREILRVSLESILPQVDQVHLVLNGYGDIPEWLNNERITVITDSEVGDHSDNAKFLGMNKYKECIYFSIDDDILYPKDYTSKLLDAISYYGGNAAVGVHGSLVDSRANAFLSRRTIAFMKALENDMPCSYVGTGTLAIRRSIMPHSPISIFPQKGASDLFLARYLKFHQIPVICVRRPEGWLRDLPNLSGHTLWKQGQKNHKIQDMLLEESGPWHVNDIMQRCQDMILKLLDKDIAVGLEAAFLLAAGKKFSTSIAETIRCSRQSQMAFKFYTGKDYISEAKITKS